MSGKSGQDYYRDEQKRQADLAASIGSRREYETREQRAEREKNEEEFREYAMMAATTAVTLPMGPISGIIAGLLLDYGPKIVSDAVTAYVPKNYNTGKPQQITINKSDWGSEINPKRYAVKELTAEQRAEIEKRGAERQLFTKMQSEAEQRYRDIKQTKESTAAALEQARGRYAGLPVTKSAIATPITYIAPKINSTYVDNSALLAAHDARLAKNSVLAAQAQVAQAETQEKASSAYYQAVQRMASEQQTAQQKLLDSVRNQMATIKTVAPTPTVQRRLPPVISSQGKVVAGSKKRR